ncbi:MAG: hypothetical protein ABIW46_07750 [Acidimicrobiales bacterium]
MVRRGRRQGGSVLMLVPAGVLVLVILGAIAVDAAIAFLAQRELAGLATAAANDAAAAAVSGPGFYSPGHPATVAVDPDLARRIVDQTLAAQTVRGIDGLTVDVRTTPSQVCVVLTGHVGYLFAKAVPGAANGTTVTGRAVASTVEGPPGAVVGTRTGC